MPATIEVITGPMFTNKSWELINRVHLSGFARQRTLCVKPIEDTRNIGCIIARGLDEHGRDFPVYTLQAHTINDPREILGHLERARPHVLAIDEGHLFKPALVDVIKELRDRDSGPALRIIIAGLDMDYRREPFMNMALLAAMADRGVFKPLGVCMQCGAEGAAYTQALHPMTSNAESGSKELYEICCRACHTIL